MGDYRGSEQKYSIPDGWEECPQMGKPVGEIFIPMKVPLAGQNAAVPDAYRFTPADVVQQVAEQGSSIALVVDLTNSERYYKPQEWARLRVQYCKIPCRGRGCAPDAFAVNTFVWFCSMTIRDCISRNAAERPRILVHCTHGFNRTGYMIVSALMRLYPERKPLESRLAEFARARPPGIYKEHYVAKLFKYYHESRSPRCVTPPVPLWKGENPETASPEDVDPEEEEPPVQAHDDLIGEEVVDGEADYIRRHAYFLVTGQEDVANPRFPGSQPVSLDRTNVSLLAKRRYLVTWKADGTRYMLYVDLRGAYLIDRSYNVRRVQLRWPTAYVGQDRQRHIGIPLGGALLDGEMVVDEIHDDNGSRLFRRYLIYDVIALNNKSVTSLPFDSRLALVDKLLEGRELEKRRLGGARPGGWSYDYGAEAFSVRKKDFWPLHQSRTIIEKFIPGLCHESDGLILQPQDDAYTLGTCHELLKWKFAHMNSVDFKLMLRPGLPVPCNELHPGDFELQVLHTSGQRGQHQHKECRPITATVTRTADGAHESHPVALDMAGEDAHAYEGRVIECTWDDDAKTWVFMRDRKDKDFPNHERVFHSVMNSINDALEQDELLEMVNGFLLAPIYKVSKDQLAMLRDPKRRKHDYTMFASGFK